MIKSDTTIKLIMHIGYTSNRLSITCAHSIIEIRICLGQSHLANLTSLS